MTEPTLQQRLLRIQMRFEAYDQHSPDCNCLFCDALAALTQLRSELRAADIQAQRAVTA